MYDQTWLSVVVQFFLVTIPNYQTRRDRLRQERISERTNAALDLLALINTNRQMNAPKKLKRIELRNGYDSDDDSNYDLEEIVVETVVSFKKEEIQ